MRANQTIETRFISVPQILGWGSRCCLTAVPALEIADCTKTWFAKGSAYLTWALDQELVHSDSAQASSSEAERPVRGRCSFGALPRRLELQARAPLIWSSAAQAGQLAPVLGVAVVVAWHAHRIAERDQKAVVRRVVVGDGTTGLEIIATATR